VHLMLGEMGEELLLNSERAVPKRLTDLGFEFKFADLKKAIENAVK
jgi:NAD dependent epimerase/dehydratase family enzyme